MAVQKIESMRSKDPGGVSRPNLARRLFALTVLVLQLISSSAAFAQEKQMIVRMSEIQVVENYLEQYKDILQEEAEASVKLEHGVIAIFPMYHRESDTEFRILEIYASREAYESHLKTPHFQKYKSSTLHMVNSLKLVDMQPIDVTTMKQMFSKMKTGQ